MQTFHIHDPRTGAFIGTVQGESYEDARYTLHWMRVSREKKLVNPEAPAKRAPLPHPEKLWDQ